MYSDDIVSADRKKILTQVFNHLIPGLEQNIINVSEKTPLFQEV